MVFSSVLVYQDPTNWQQQPNQQPAGGTENNPQLPPPVPPPPPVGGGGAGSGRPGSTADRARLAKLPQLDQVALKCPRCESTNTKFCYFNNYSLTQPRHFCKTCRRYWTRGGALRNVPVGGGCRRNKRSKGSRSKSPATSEHQAGNSSSTSVVSSKIGPLPGQPQQLPFLPSLHHLSDYGAGDIGLNFVGIQPPTAVTGGGSGMEFQIGTSSSGCGPILSDRFAEQWRLQQVQQFPFLAGLEPPAGIYQFEGEGVEPSGYIGGVTAQLGSKPLDSRVTHELATMKLEENQGLNLSRNFLGIPGNDQYWGGNAWTDLTGFTSSSTSHLS
ncbi:hypothetical protein F0562_026141 [Nyssa sinensis]|uniref:Dof zinc finger protein n=1 Tax=Nyssa sinensis TaxID=561372 RepID=A0A5J5B9Z4_9ASTE|nr:hypothetical protein F0562_026141 [Nyssa sinensis]